MITLYFHPSPNPLKIALYLEEAVIPYEVVPIDNRKGDQHRPAFYPAAQRAQALTDRFSFKQEVDDAVRAVLFPQNARLGM